MERGHLAADVTIQCTVFVVFRTYLPLQPFDGLGLYTCTHHSCRSGASFRGEEYRHFALRLELRWSYQSRGDSYPKKALVAEGVECSANTAEKEQRVFKAQSCQLAHRASWFLATLSSVTLFLLSTLKVEEVLGCWPKRDSVHCFFCALPRAEKVMKQFLWFLGAMTHCPVFCPTYSFWPGLPWHTAASILLSSHPYLSLPPLFLVTCTFERFYLSLLLSLSSFH